MSSPVLIKRVDDSDKVAIATTGGKIYFFDVMNPERREVVDVTQKINMLKGVNLVLNEITTVPAVADIDGDGNDDLVFATGAYYVAALNTVGQTIMWAYKIMPFSTLATPARYSSPVLTDLDDDGTPDVIIGWANGKIIALNGNNGETIWEYYTSRENRIISSIALADINKDGIMDPVIAGEDGSVFVLDGAPDANQRLMSNRVSTKGPVSSTPCIGDIDGDSLLEIVVTSVKNQLYVFNTPTKVFKREIFWESFRKDSKNSGALFHVSMGMKFNALIGAGILLIIGVFFNIRFSKKKRLSKLPPVIIGKKK